MEIPDAVQDRLNMAIQAWNYAERIHDDIIKLTKERPLRDRDMLLLHSSQLLLESRSIELRDIDSPIRTHSRAEDELADWDSSLEKAHRYTDRYREMFYYFVVFYDSLIPKLSAGQFIKSSLKEHTLGLAEMVQTLLYERTRPDSLGWVCNIGGDCGLDDHFHSRDNLVWPIHEAGLESQIPLVSFPDIVFRDFQFEALSTKDSSKVSLTSAMNAAKESIRYKYGETMKIPTDDSGEIESWAVGYECSAIDLLLGKKQTPQALARIGHALSEAVKAHGRDIALGIILPGGSQIFRPCHDEWSDRTVYVKAYEVQVNIIDYNSDEDDVEDRRVDRFVSYRFQPIKEGIYAYGTDTVQTRDFLDLPPEVRNMIYEQILEQDIDGSAPFQSVRQPAMALTCRLVNTEIMSLMFKKSGWFVSN